MKLESLVQFLDGYLEVAGFPDYDGAHNGLQVESEGPIRKVGAAVDASGASISAAANRECDLLLVHHGLFWGGAAPVTGRRYRRLAALLRNGVALYSAHLPLDAHPEVGNCIRLARALGVEVEERFGTFADADIGWRGRVQEQGREELRERIAETVGREVRLLAGGPERVRTVGVVTGGAASMIPDAARAGLDAFVTGEGAHHTYFDAVELGVNVYYAGHYATETWGVRALAEVVAERHDLPWEFIDLPTGL
jgi:dinuclear metal center YbgI/SA1388 family protein